MPTALIVEDEPEANKLLALLVQLRGYSTVSAFTGSEALAKVKLGRPDIVFLDLMLPDINGYEVCRQLKSGRQTSLIPVVMVTARVAAENRQQSFSIGADDYIPKPYTPDQIFQAMDEADAWRKHVERDAEERAGTITFHVGSDESLRQIAQLRNLLVARTPLEVDAVGRLQDVLQGLRAGAERWGRHCDVEAPASLTYQILPDRVIFTLLDHSDWIGVSHPCPAEASPDTLADAGFDSIHYRRDEGAIGFSRSFGSGRPTNGSVSS